MNAMTKVEIERLDGARVVGDALWRAATSALAAAAGDRLKAAHQFKSCVKRDEAMLSALALHYLNEVAEQTLGESLPGQVVVDTHSYGARQAEQFSAQAEGGGRSSSDTQSSHASARNDDVSGHGRFATHSGRARPSSANSGGAGHLDRANHSVGVRHLREPSRAQRAGDWAGWRAQTRTILDTFRARDGRAVGDLEMWEVRRFAKENDIEHRVLVAIAGRYANAKDTDRVRDLISATVLEAIVSEAKDAANAA